MGIVSFFVAFAAIGQLATEPAQVSRDAPIDAVPVCELHVWPGSGLGSVYNGWLHGGINNGAVDGRPGYRTVQAEPISTEVQRALLSEMDMARLVGMPNHRVHFHEQALESRVIRTTAGSIVAPRPTCYAELIVDDVVFQQDVVDGRYLKMLLRFRAFGTSDLPTRVFGTWVKTRLTAFPPADVTGVSAAEADIKAAYKADLISFGNYLNAPPKKPKQP